MYKYSNPCKDLLGNLIDCITKQPIPQLNGQSMNSPLAYTQLNTPPPITYNMVPGAKVPQLVSSSNSTVNFQDYFNNKKPLTVSKPQLDYGKSFKDINYNTNIAGKGPSVELSQSKLNVNMTPSSTPFSNPVQGSELRREFGTPNYNNIALFAGLTPLLTDISQNYENNQYSNRFDTPLSGESNNVKYGYSMYRYGGKKCAPKIRKFKDGGEISQQEELINNFCYDEKGNKIPCPQGAAKGTKVFTDSNKFKQAQQNYNDSLYLYNLGEKDFQKFKDFTSKNNLKSSIDNPGPYVKGKVPAPNGFLSKKIKPIAYATTYYKSDENGRPIRPVRLVKENSGFFESNYHSEKESERLNRQKAYMFGELLRDFLPYRYKKPEQQIFYNNNVVSNTKPSALQITPEPGVPAKPKPLEQHLKQSLDQYYPDADLDYTKLRNNLESENLYNLLKRPNTETNKKMLLKHFAKNKTVNQVPATQASVEPQENNIQKLPVVQEQMYETPTQQVVDQQVPAQQSYKIDPSYNPIYGTGANESWQIANLENGKKRLYNMFTKQLEGEEVTAEDINRTISNNGMNSNARKLFFKNKFKKGGNVSSEEDGFIVNEDGTITYVADPKVGSNHVIVNTFKGFNKDYGANYDTDILLDPLNPVFNNGHNGGWAGRSYATYLPGFKNRFSGGSYDYDDPLNIALDGKKKYDNVKSPQPFGVYKSSSKIYDIKTPGTYHVAGQPGITSYKDVDDLWGQYQIRMEPIKLNKKLTIDNFYDRYKKETKNFLLGMPENSSESAETPDQYYKRMKNHSFGTYYHDHTDKSIPKTTSGCIAGECVESGFSKFLYNYLPSGAENATELKKSGSLVSYNTDLAGYNKLVEQVNSKIKSENGKYIKKQLGGYNNPINDEQMYNRKNRKKVGLIRYNDGGEVDEIEEELINEILAEDTSKKSTQVVPEDIEQVDQKQLYRKQMANAMIQEMLNAPSKSLYRYTNDEIDPLVNNFSKNSQLLESASYLNNYNPSDYLEVQATRYGFAADPNKDANSLNAIGAWSNKLKAQESVALKQSTVKKLGLKKNDKIEIILPNGQKIIRTYHDHIPESSGNNDRLDFYVPDGKLSFDGSKLKIRKITQ